MLKIEPMAYYKEEEVWRSLIVLDFIPLYQSCIPTLVYYGPLVFQMTMVHELWLPSNGSQRSHVKIIIKAVQNS